MASISPQRHLPTRLAAGAATAAALLGAVCATMLALASPAAAGTHAVMIEHYAYSPAALSVDQGDTVTWTNMDSVQHDVTVTTGPTSFHSPMLAQGQSWSFTFTRAGAYGYICSVHPDMRASVTVTARAAAPSKPAPATKAGAPQVAPTTASTGAAPRVTRRHHRAPATVPAATQVAAPAATQELATTPAAVSTESLNPLLLVAGASTAVMVFCLLLMASRPVALPAATEDEPVFEPVEEPEDA